MFGQASLAEIQYASVHTYKHTEHPHTTRYDKKNKLYGCCFKYLKMMVFYKLVTSKNICLVKQV
jgi:hypothetical protein